MDIINIISLVIAVTSVALYLIDRHRKKEYPGRITYTEKAQINLKSGITSNFQGFKILHNETLITNNVHYLHGALSNNGLLDISSLAPDRGITISLEETDKWLDLKVEGSNKDISPTITIDSDAPNLAHLNFDLLKKEELITFEALIESAAKTTDNIKLSFSHRLNNTSDITENEILNQRKYALFKRNYRLLILYFISTIVMILGALFSTSSPLLYVNKVENPKTKYVARINNKNKIVVYDSVYAALELWQLEKNELTIDEFKEHYDISPTYSSTIYMIKCILFSIVAAITLLMCIYTWWKLHSTTKVHKKLDRDS